MRIRRPLSAMRPLRPRPCPAAVLMVAAGLAAGTAAHGVHATDRVEAQTLDWRWVVRGERAPDERLAILSIDDQSLQDLGIGWPIPRDVHARVVERLTALGAAEIVYNQQFDLAGPPAADSHLLTAISQAPAVVLPATERDDEGPRFLGGGRANREASRASFGGDIQVDDEDGAVRRFAVHDAPLHLATVPLVAARRALGRSVQAPGPTPWVDIVARPCALNGRAAPDGRLRCAIPAFALESLLHGTVRDDAFADKVVVVGPTGSDQQVLRRTWAGPQLMTTTELLAQEIGTALQRFPLRSVPWWVALLATALLGAVPASIASMIRARLGTSVTAPSWASSAGRVLAAGGMVAACGTAAATLAFAHGQVAPVAWPLVSIATTTCLAAWSTASVVRARAAEVWRTAAALAPQQIVERVVLETRGRGLPEGEPVVMTILFADVRDSTRYVMALATPGETWAFSQAFLRHATAAIHARGGYAQSLEGDGLLAMFGPGHGGPRHAYLAVQTARELAGAVLDRARDEVASTLPDLATTLAARPLGVRVSVHTGGVLYGASGSEEDEGTSLRLAASTVGQTTHVAAKLRAAASFAQRRQWAEEDRDTLFPHNDADERIVVVTDAAMQAATACQAWDEDVAADFTRTSVEVAHAWRDVWVVRGSALGQVRDEGGGEDAAVPSGTGAP